MHLKYLTSNHIDITVISIFTTYVYMYHFQRHNPGGGGGVLRFGSDGDVPLKPPNPYPSLRVILAEKGTHY